MKRIIIATAVVLLISAIYLISTEKPYYFFRLDRNVDIANLNSTLDNLYSVKQDKKFRVVVSTPSTSTMTKGEVLFLKQTSNFKLFVRDDDGSIYYTEVLTAL
jgi:hypothetical protein